MIQLKVLTPDAAALWAGVSREAVLHAVERGKVKKFATILYYGRRGVDLLSYRDVYDNWVAKASEEDQIGYTMRHALLDASVAVLRNERGLGYETDFELEVVGMDIQLTFDGGEMRKALKKSQEADTD